ncbi:MAG: tail fiber domain-containing protein, partial [candidate division WOR-3 bacterium]
AVIGSKIQDNAIISSKIQDGTILRQDVASNFKAPYADTSDYARNVNIQYVDSARVSVNAYNAYKLQGKDTLALDSRYVNEGQVNAINNAMITGNAITSDKILDGTITRSDVSLTFKAPLADTADYARYLPGAIDSARVSANAHKLQGKDTIALSAKFVDEGQVNSISSAMIVDGTITRSDVSSTFKAPYADTADYVRNLTVNYVDSARISANSHKLQGKDTIALSAKFVDEGQVNSITTGMITDGNVTMSKINQASATTGQVLKWTGSAWAPRNDSIGSGLFLPLSGGTMTGPITSTGDPEIKMGKGNFGSGNINTGTQAFVAGSNNRARGAYSVVSGGGGIGVGDSNSANGDFSVVGGGSQNTANGVVATISGGYINTASGSFSTVAGGYANTASSILSTIGGGISNIASGNNATVCGGGNNKAHGVYSVVSGGGGTRASDSNSVQGHYAMIPGGRANIANGNYAFAAGRCAKANHSGSFVWADSTDAYFTSSADNQFNIRASGGTRIFSNAGLTAGVILSAGGSSWSSVSDRAMKRNIRPVNTKEILDKHAQLPINQWSYKSQDPSIEHIGPIAQDFYALFGLGENDKTISTIDPSGIALAAIQELAKQNQELTQKYEDLQEKLEYLLNEIENPKSQKSIDK